MTASDACVRGCLTGRTKDSSHGRCGNGKLSIDRGLLSSVIPIMVFLTLLLLFFVVAVVGRCSCMHVLFTVLVVIVKRDCFVLTCYYAVAVS